jgi:preprotein translocase subunit SecA
MFKFFKNLFDEEAKKIKKYQLVVDQINAFEPAMQELSDADLAAQTDKFKTIISEAVANVSAENLKEKEQAVLNEILPEAYATVREASRRILGMRHFDVQLLAGVALNDGNITEQKTGEGKTLTVTCPLYLNALLGKSVQLITVNDYLSEIGLGWMGPLYHFLGLKAAVIVHDHARLYNPNIDSEERGDERLEHFEEIARQDAYLADITYGTNNEFGFDYLRDNMVQSLDQMVQRQSMPHYFAIVDEADSILIDEARTPLIISAPDSEPTDKYFEYAKMVRSLVIDQDFKLDEKSKTATLTDLGVKRIEAKLGVKNLYEESFDTIHHVESSLKASTLYRRDKEYIVKDNQVVIVDEHTGRLMFGRRYSDGLHQAIEAKEGVPIQQESRTLATVSLQNYFRMYQKLSGMTGTALTEAEEFNQIYHVDVLAIPTNQPVVRQDLPDQVYKNTAAKYSSIVKAVEEIHAAGRPVLIGTRSIEHNQIVANFLKRKNITHQVLNAKNHEKEAFIIADAGRRGAITVATNIAGRGVDIVLGGAKPELKDFLKEERSKKRVVLAKKYEKLGLPTSINPANYDLDAYATALEKWQADHDDVVSVGGLAIVATERHESRRIDNQLRGRSGRQGDPGTSQFFVALDDEIMRIFGGEQIAKVMDFLKIDEDQAIENPMVSKAIESAQVKVETFFFDQRKRLVEFDDVMNKHREIIYKRRRRLLEAGTVEVKSNKGSDDKLATVMVDEAGKKITLKDQIMDYLSNEITGLVTLRAPEKFTQEEFDAISKEFVRIIPFDDASQTRLATKLSKLSNTEEISEELMDIINKTYESREKSLGEAIMRELEKYVVLSTIDEKWMDHLDAVEDLREGIWLRGDKNTVLAEYKKEAFIMFEDLIAGVESTIAARIFRVQPMMQRSTMPEKINLQAPSESTPSLGQAVQVERRQENAGSGNSNRGNGGSGKTSDLAAALGKMGGGSSSNVGRNLNQSTDKYAKVGRNDLCPCGSGLKYKKCGLINSPSHQA